MKIQITKSISEFKKGDVLTVESETEKAYKIWNNKQISQWVPKACAEEIKETENLKEGATFEHPSFGHCVVIELNGTSVKVVTKKAGIKDLGAGFVQKFL